MPQNKNVDALRSAGCWLVQERMNWENKLDLNKQLVVKTKTVLRCRKDIAYYIKEIEEQTALIARWKGGDYPEGKDVHDLKQQEGVKEEAEMVMPDCKTRLEQAVEDLDMFVEEMAEDELIAGTEELTAARALLLEFEEK